MAQHPCTLTRCAFPQSLAKSLGDHKLFSDLHASAYLSTISPGLYDDDVSMNPVFGIRTCQSCTHRVHIPSCSVAAENHPIPVQTNVDNMQQIRSFAWGSYHQQGLEVDANVFVLMILTTIEKQQQRKKCDLLVVNFFISHSAGHAVKLEEQSYTCTCDINSNCNSTLKI